MKNKPKPKANMNIVSTPRRRGHQLPTRVSEALWKDLEAVAAEEKRDVSPTVILLLEEALRARGRLTAPPYKGRRLP